MGTVAFGLSQIGSALQQARDQRRQEAIDKQYADIAQQYAGTNKQRAEQERAEFEERMRVARLPKFIGFRTVGGRLYYGLQNPDGSVKTNEVTGITSAQDAQALETAIEALPAEAQPAARAAIVPYIQAEDYPGARAALKPISEANAKNAMPQPTTTTITSGTQRQWVDDPAHPGRYMLQDVPIENTRTTFKGRGSPPQITPPTTPPKAPLVRTPPSQMPKNQALKPEMDAGLRVLHASLWGSGGVPGLDSTLQVLDSPMSRTKLITAGAGKTPNSSDWTITKLLHGGMYAALTGPEKAYAYQLNRAISAINALRNVTGLPRSTQALMDRYIMELPDPVTTPSAADARTKLQLIEREIQAAMNTGGTGAAGGGPAIPTPLGSGATDQPGAPQPQQPPPPKSIDDVLDGLFGAKKTPTPN